MSALRQKRPFHNRSLRDKKAVVRFRSSIRGRKLRISGPSNLCLFRYLHHKTRPCEAGSGCVTAKCRDLRQTAAGEPGSDCREQAPGPDPGLHRRAAKEARHVPFGQGAAATWPEESYVQGRIDGTPGRRVARSGSFTRRPLERQVSTPTHRKAAILLPPSDISNWRKS